MSLVRYRRQTGDEKGDGSAHRFAAQRTGNLNLGTPAARASPIAAPFETNQEAKDWLVVAPGGAPTYEVRNLRLWCERNARHFEPDDWRKAYTGLRQVASWMRGKTKRKVGSWKGWTLDQRLVK